LRLRHASGCDRLARIHPAEQNRDGEYNVGATIFLNPRAGAGKAARRVGDVLSAFRELNFAAKLIETASAVELRKRARAEIGQGCMKLAAIGGDGTLQLLAREATGCDAAIGVIPLGGGNDFAAALGIHSWKQAVRAIVEGRTRLVDVVKVSFENGQESRYLGGGGAGLDAEAARYASGRFGRWPGRLRYLAAAIQAFSKYPGADLEVTSGAEQKPEFKGRGLLAAALNTPSYGGGVRLAPEAQVDDGMLDFVVLEGLGKVEIIRLLPGLLFTGKLETNRIKRFRATSARLRTLVPIAFHGDGELHGATPLTIEVEPKALRMLVP
jgi:diacylglycerol kinase (ATP)